MDALKSCIPTTREPDTPQPRSTDETLKANAVDTGIDFNGKDSHWPDIRTRKSGLIDRTTALVASQNLPSFLHKLPKAELHVHIEGTVTPQRVQSIAVRNGLPNVADFAPAKGAVARQGYVEGSDILEYCKGENALNAFLTEYNRCSGVYRTEQDFYDIMMDYRESTGCTRIPLPSLCPLAFTLAVILTSIARALPLTPTGNHICAPMSHFHAFTPSYLHTFTPSQSVALPPTESSAQRSSSTHRQYQNRNFHPRP